MQRTRSRIFHRSATTRERRIVAAASAAALACIVAACGGGGESDTPRAGLRVDSEICPGVDLEKLSYLRVSSGGPPDGIWATVALAYDLGYRAVVVQHGLYQTTKTIDLSNGISLYGGCLFDGEPDRKYRTVIQAAPAPGTPAILAHGVNVTVSGVVVIGKDETASGAASVAMTAANANVTLRRTVLVAGKGGAGAGRPPVQSRAGVRGTSNRCYTPGGAASDTQLWGQVDLGSFAWVAGIGGAGAGGVYDTGPGGVGGQQGGASIGLLLVNAATVTTVADEFNRIVGGSGGVGGAGQAGPSFGLGGGANSGGAGGNGGPSIGVASINAASVPSGVAYIYANAPGEPGAGGAAGVDAGQCSGDPGAPGVRSGSLPVHHFHIQNTLLRGETLAGGQSLYSPNLQFHLTLRGDGDLCLYSAGGNALWCSKTQGQEIYQAIMQSDGNFCMYEISGQVDFFCSGTAHPGDRLTVQDSGHAQVIDPNGAVLWSVP